MTDVVTTCAVLGNSQTILQSYAEGQLLLPLERNHDNLRNIPNLQFPMTVIGKM